MRSLGYYFCSFFIVGLSLVSSCSINSDMFFSKSSTRLPISSSIYDTQLRIYDTTHLDNYIPYIWKGMRGRHCTYIHSDM